MSPKVPVVTAKELIRVLEMIGYKQVRQRGSHIRIVHPSLRPVTVPNHKEIRVGLLVKILRDADLTTEDLVRLLSEK